MSNVSPLWRKSACWLLLLLLLPSVHGQTARYNDKISRDPAVANACKQRLSRLHEALSEFQRKNKRLPNWISELYPEFVDDPKTFICPFVQKLGDFQVWRDGVRSEVFYDPNLTTSYAYEFSAADYPLGDGASTTVQEFKKRQTGQMGLRAGDVPILRCFAHRPVLNLPLSGEIYDSDIDWEENFSEWVNFRDLLPGHIFAAHGSPKNPVEHAQLQRDPKLTSEFVDLTKFYNGLLTDTWQPNPFRGNDLAHLPQGAVTLGSIGVKFDVRGVVQLAGKTFAGAFPEKVECIPVDRSCQSIHFLHSSAYNTAMNTEIGRYLVRFAGGKEVKIPIRYGVDVLDWWFDPKAPRPQDVTVAWEGVNQAAKSQGNLVRLYHTRWSNPEPAAKIECISFISTMSEAAPFLIAITLE